MEPALARLRPFNLRWLEEPIWPPESFDGLARLRREGGIPIAAGENASTLVEFQQMLALEAQLYGDAVLPKNGMMTVPQGPGLGFDPDADVVRTFKSEVELSFFNNRRIEI